ncbi:hypothetical protein IscW_ISCW011004 [Ixodes scapularis]|uniref:Uncharacterized protein n=1 Tax=Ixodes scapularis TaxID=6945 RepID=B7Q961_IXOSC|nr:hypothetical protein IscW_ISCW011004 [Ixodes scapularis]|eukprot:XP_002405635.1 hypothetical protein IscW_ISCW011004 [Ixodes scapularis]
MAIPQILDSLNYDDTFLTIQASICVPSLTRQHSKDHSTPGVVWPITLLSCHNKSPQGHFLHPRRQRHAPKSPTVHHTDHRPQFITCVTLVSQNERPTTNSSLTKAEARRLGVCYATPTRH